MSQDQRKRVQFQHHVDILPFNKRQSVINLLEGSEKEVSPLNDEESEYSKRRRTMKRKRASVSREGVRQVLERQKDIEAQFWAAYCRVVWGKIKRLCKEACYGCSHRKTEERHHNVCQLSDEECIRRFMEMAVNDLAWMDVVNEWYGALSDWYPPLTTDDMMVFDTQWVVQQMERPDRTAILLEMMIDNEMVQPSMTDEELVEAVETLEKEQQKPEEVVMVDDDDDDMFEFSDEFFEAMKRWQEEEEEQQQQPQQEQEPCEVSFLYFFFFFFFISYLFIFPLFT